MNGRSLADWLQIAGELTDLYQQARAAAQADGRITVTEAVAFAGQVLGILAKYNVTIVELQQLLTQIGPILALLRLR